MALSGLRDMSSIDEAPGDRHPVQTYVLEYNLGVITDAINKEIRRGGQVYYLHNRVESIERCAGVLKAKLPDINIGIAHGQMSEDELTKLISETSTQVQKLEQRKSELSNQLDSLKDTADKNEKAAEIARQNAESNGILSGRLPVSGEGVVIRISKGSKRDIDASILFTLLEELRNSGAEVIEINDIRVITSTYISDTADGLDCDGTNIKAPFIIRAIGDSDNLQNAVNLAGGVGSRLKVKYGATVSIVPSDKVEITSTRSAPQYTHAHVVE